MTKIADNILLLSVAMPPLIVIIRLYILKHFFTSTPDRKYWTKKDIFQNIIKLCISLIVVINWFVFISNFNIKIGINQNQLNTYLYFTQWVLGFLGAYLVYKLLKYLLVVIVGIIMLLIQRKSQHINNSLLKAINDEDDVAAITNSKLLIQSNGCIDIGQREFNKLLLILFTAEEYKTANSLTKGYISNILFSHNPKILK
mgnify:CR=1 FL=1|jgi:hypothetical protein